jgi:hypothetical protein
MTSINDIDINLKNDLTFGDLPINTRKSLKNTPLTSSMMNILGLKTTNNFLQPIIIDKDKQIPTPFNNKETLEYTMYLIDGYTEATEYILNKKINLLFIILLIIILIITILLVLFYYLNYNKNIESLNKKYNDLYLQINPIQ